MFKMTMYLLLKMFTSCATQAEQTEPLATVVDWEFTEKPDANDRYTVRMVVDFKLSEESVNCTWDYIDLHGILF